VTDKFRLALVWIAGAICSLIVAIAPLSASLANGHYVPIGADAFYHARRILDAAGPIGFYEFDRFMHVPEGSLVTWPWGYDYLMSLIVRTVHTIFGVEPMAALAQIPMLSFPLAIALIVLLCRRVGLGIPATLMAAVFTAFFPLNQTLYAVGAIDHHFAEHLFVLATLVAGLSWLSNPGSLRLAVLTGVLLGLAPAFQNGLFILQLPLLATLILWWARKVPLPRTTRWFGVALVVTTVLIDIPSTSFRQGRFEFYTLSWFHLYAAAATAIAVVAISRFAFSWRNFGLFVLVAIAAAWPLADQFLVAGKFLGANIEGMQQISEAQSLRQTYGNGGITMLATSYSWAIFLLPLTLILAAWRLVKDNEPHLWLFWIASLFGLGMVIAQMRLHYFGSFALYVPWLVIIQRWVNTQPALNGRIALVVAASLLGAACAPGVRHKLFERGVVSGDPVYDVTRAIYPMLAQACAEQPGVTLTWPDDGHYVRYHTSCSVIANPFLMTPLHEEKIRRVNGLMKLSAADLLVQAPDVQYVLARKGTLFYLAPNGEVVMAPYENPMDPEPKLIDELLKAPVDHLPPGYHLIQQMTLDQAGKQPVVRLLKIDRSTTAAAK